MGEVLALMYNLNTAKSTIFNIPAYHCCGLRTPRRRQGTTRSVFQGDRTQISREAGGDLGREIWRTLLHSLLTANEEPFNAGVV